MNMPGVVGSGMTRNKDSEAAFEGAQPGVLGPELLEALGLGPLDPPPWLGMMQRLGVPPGGTLQQLFRGEDK